MGGVFMLIAALLVVRDVGAETAPKEHAVFEAAAHEKFTLPESAQPVPNTGAQPVCRIEPEE